MKNRRRMMFSAPDKRFFVFKEGSTSLKNGSFVSTSNLSFTGGYMNLSGANLNIKGIDFTNFSTLYIEAANGTHGYGKYTPSGTPNFYEYKAFPSVRSVKAFDISSRSESPYIKLTASSTAKVYNIWLE